jgi:hypothetical protein
MKGTATSKAAANKHTMTAKRMGGWKDITSAPFELDNGERV